MATTRRTRNSVAAGAGGAENDLAAKSAVPAQATGKGLKALKPVVTTRAAASKTVAVKAVSTTSTTVAGARKRAAFTDVTNASKAKTTSAAASASTNTFTKPAAGSSTTARRSYRTRSSTGGSAIKLDADGNEVDGSEVAEEEDDAMAIDQEVPVAAPPPRAIKSLKRSAPSATSVPLADPAAKVKSSTTTATGRRAPLASKRANACTATAAASTTTNVSKATLALRARQRREAAELRQAEAMKEVEEARRAEEELAHRSKKARTSEPDHYDEEEEEEEIEVLEEDDVQIEERDDYFVETETGLAKDHGWEDLDEGDEEDPLMVSAYVVEVYEYLRELELTTMPDVDYMANQNEVTWKMRGILVDWLIEIHTKFRLLPETIFLATNIIDRFLSTRVVSLVKFQLVGVTALFIAAKYEEVVCPSVSNFLYMTDGGYGDDEILKAERYVLSMIDFNLSYPNPINFLRRISKADGYDIQSRTMAKYLMEISIVDHKFMGVTPSLIAAAGNWLARRVLDKGPWDANLVHYSGYTEEELKPTAQLMLDYVVRTSPILSADAAASGDSSLNPLQTSPISHEVEHPNFIKKYAAKKFFKASSSIRKWAEEEYAPTERYNPVTRKVDRRVVRAVL